MRMFHNWTGLPVGAQGGVISLGNFDGVHRGHQRVIGEAVSSAKEMGLPAGVITFEPHPRSFFRADAPPSRLTPLPAKIREMEALGVNHMIVLAFDEALSQMSAEDFVHRVLVGGLAVRQIVVGHDFVFGSRRSGTTDHLIRWGGELGFEVSVIAPAGVGGDIFSSTKIRQALTDGDIERATAALGRPFEIAGPVVTGDRRGRTIGFPTANVPLSEYIRPAFGVYAVDAAVDTGIDLVWHRGVANIGKRPTFDGTTELLEAHLFDFNGDLYGKPLRVRLHKFIRPERKFDSIETLRAQIHQDSLQSYSAF